MYSPKVQTKYIIRTQFQDKKCTFNTLPKTKIIKSEIAKENK